ncbi:MAG: hypothetical protein IBJ10_01265 [Phycisphaerales bacterium]|nr:hypothetical protein [Phycisphaerales bacterium]
MAAKTKKPGKKLAAPLTGVDGIGWRQLYLLGKAADAAAKKLRADADSDVAPGAYPIDAVVRITGDAVVAEAVPPSKGTKEIVVAVGPTALLVALLIAERPEVLSDDEDLPTGALDKVIRKALDTLAGVWADKSVRARVERIGEQANETLERLATEAGFVEQIVKGRHDGRAGAVRCDPAVHVEFVSVGERRATDPGREADDE